MEGGQEISLKERNMFQQWFSLCYSLQLFASYANLTPVTPDGKKFTLSTDMGELVTNLFHETSKPASKKGKRKSSSRKRKEQPKKKRKSH